MKPQPPIIIINKSSPRRINNSIVKNKNSNNSAELESSLIIDSMKKYEDNIITLLDLLNKAKSEREEFIRAIHYLKEDRKKQQALIAEINLKRELEENCFKNSLGKERDSFENRLLKDKNSIQIRNSLIGEFCTLLLANMNKFADTDAKKLLDKAYKIVPKMKIVPSTSSVQDLLSNINKQEYNINSKEPIMNEPNASLHPLSPTTIKRKLKKKKSQITEFKKSNNNHSSNHVYNNNNDGSINNVSNEETDEDFGDLNRMFVKNAGVHKLEYSDLDFEKQQFLIHSSFNEIENMFDEVSAVSCKGPDEKTFNKEFNDLFSDQKVLQEIESPVQRPDAASDAIIAADRYEDYLFEKGLFEAPVMSRDTSVDGLGSEAGMPAEGSRFSAFMDTVMSDMRSRPSLAAAVATKSTDSCRS